MKKRITRCVAVCLAALMAFAPVTVMADNQTYVSLGESLNADEKATVLNLMGLTEETLNQDVVLTVSNAEEHQYLDSYVDPAVIGSRALSSCKVTMTNDTGIHVTTHNITYCTPSMYENALATAGVKNADVVVAGPFEISGTAALVGALKAYATMTGDILEPEIVDAAVNELTTTGALADSVGDQETIAQLIAALKQAIANGTLKSDGDIDKAIDDISAQMGVTLTDSDKALLKQLLAQLATMDLDPDTLAAQAHSAYEELKSQGLDLSQYGITDAQVNSFISLFSKLGSVISRFLRMLMG
ncbi:MAG: DUF1002 domain-containing protein [Lachnospiraceae bacterium]|nr:DUF1002 domain-containing protein [Candidatus Equihabitans merdae]